MPRENVLYLTPAWPATPQRSPAAYTLGSEAPIERWGVLCNTTMADAASVSVSSTEDEVTRGRPMTPLEESATLSPELQALLDSADAGLAESAKWRSDSKVRHLPPHGKPRDCPFTPPPP